MFVECEVCLVKVCQAGRKALVTGEMLFSVG
jgi:hypothetical protein